jgi:hypothetical protein
MNARTIALWVAVLYVSMGTSQGQKIKLIVDQDARGPPRPTCSHLIFLQSEKSMFWASPRSAETGG